MNKLENDGEVAVKEESQTDEAAPVARKTRRNRRSEGTIQGILEAGYRLRKETAKPASLAQLDELSAVTQRLLGITRATLRKRIEKFGIHREMKIA